MKKLLALSFLLIAICSFAQTSLDSGLVLYYPFNGNATDSSSNGINATLINNPVYTADHNGNLNSAILLDGIDDYIQADSSQLLDNLTKSYSFSAWVRIDSWYQASQGFWAAIFDKSGVAANSIQYRLSLRNYGTYWFGPDACGDYYGNAFPTLGNWFHLIVVQNQSSISLYINGSLAGSYDCGNALTANNHPLYLGADPHIAMDYLNGALDEVRIYNRAITVNEIASLTAINSVDVSDNGFTLFPNPATSQLQLHFTEPLNLKSTLKISNIHGGIVMEEKITNQDISLDVSNLVSGIYFILLESSTGSSIRRKLIKQ